MNEVPGWSYNNTNSIFTPTVTMVVPYYFLRHLLLLNINTVSALLFLKYSGVN